LTADERAAARPPLRPALGLALLAAISVVAGYQTRRTLEVHPGAVGLHGWTLAGFSGGEGAFAWTGATASVRLPEPGPGWQGRVELELSGWRPRGQPPARVRTEAGPARLEAAPGPAPQTLTLPVTTSGAWRSDLLVRLETNAFVPGAGDNRPLGVRVYAVRLVPLTGSRTVRGAPLRVVTLAIGLVLVAFATLRRAGAGHGAAFGAAGLAVAVGAGLVFERLATVLLLPPLLAVGAGFAFVSYAAPGALHVVRALTRGTMTSLARGRRELSVRGALALVFLAAGLVSMAYAVRPRLTLDLGSGEELALAEGWGPFDRHQGETCREVRPGARLDLRDFGSGRWRLEVRAAASEATTLAVAPAGGSPFETAVGPTWTSLLADATAPVGWRSGLLLELSAPRRASVRVDRIVLERGRALPPARMVALVAVAGLGMALAFGAAGYVRPERPWRRPAWLAGGLVVLVASTALAADPVAVIPFMPWLALITVLGTGLAAIATAISEEAARRGGVIVFSPEAVAAASAGFVAWLSAAVFPRYRGGHFGFHSQIAEEIWQGHFALYYFPDPGSMLSRQAQWGNLVVPHPCLYHVLASPLAVLGAPWFHFAEKTLLAALFASMVIAASLLARRLGGEGAGTYAAVTAAALATPFQLLGLGHLMTILGVWAMTMALAWLALRWSELGRRRVWLAVAGLWTLAFLSYFAGLIFLLFVTAIVVAGWARSRPAQARALTTATLLACVLAFALYYVNWAWPFLKETLPALAGHGAPRAASTEGVSLWPRLVAEPHKLDYTFGTAFIPLFGLVGLALAPRSPERLVLLAWAAVLVVFSGVDLFFNFLLKHHYYVMVPVAVGCGVLLSRLRDRTGGLGVALVLLGMVAVGAGAALQTAMGWIP
jgi:hypothetical protein